MNKCPKCDGKLIGVDTLGVFGFEKYTLRIYWVIFAGIMLIFLSGLIYFIQHEELRKYMLYIYYASGCYLIYKLYKSKMENVVYECATCKTRFKGSSKQPFSYKEWSKNEYNKLFKKDVQ